MKNRYCLGFMVTPDFQHVVLLKKDTDKPEQQWQNGLLNGVGGRVEAYEAASDAMYREFEEETGVPIIQQEWMHCGCITDNCTYEVSCFICVAPKELLDSVRKQPKEKEEPKVYYLPLVKNRWYPLANDVMEALTMCLWVYIQTRTANTFRQFTMLTN
jgi:ADP-ribose pyrophosphatase YjhB (NUDIX family)